MGEDHPPAHRRTFELISCYYFVCRARGTIVCQWLESLQELMLHAFCSLGNWDLGPSARLLQRVIRTAGKGVWEF